MRSENITPSVAALFHLKGEKPQVFVHQDNTPEEVIHEAYQTIGSYRNSSFGLGWGISRVHMRQMIEGMTKEYQLRCEREGRFAPIGPIEEV